MADGAQHVMQGMENQDRFDLEQTLVAWRNDCLDQPGISLEDAKELEGDLRERIADLLEQGISEREAFAAAVRQVGSVTELAREFAKENPLPIWRERVFWMLLAGFAVSVWGLITNGLLNWCVNTFAEFYHWPTIASRTLGGQLPVLAAAVLLAAGRLATLAGFTEWLLQSRKRLAGIGAVLLGAGLAVRMFGLSHFMPSFGGNWLYWSVEPLILGVLCVLLFQRHYSKATKHTGEGIATAPAAVWRERIFWIALGTLAVDFWARVTMCCVTALFYGGDINHPYTVNMVVLLSVYQTIHFSPLFVIGWLVIRWKRGRTTLSARVLAGQGALTALVATVFCIWVGLSIWLSFLWAPHDARIDTGIVLLGYLTSLQWGWPLGLAALAVWLAPRPRAEDQSLEPAAR